MKEYHKIETLFERDMEGNKKLIEGKFRNPVVEYIKDLEWNFTEKIDGTNVRVHWDGHTVIFGGRTDNAQMPTPLVQKLNSLFLGITNEQLFEQKFGANPVTFYGEGYGGKIQNGTNYKETEDFILFDVECNGVFYNYLYCVELAEMFGISYVPIVTRGTLDLGIKMVTVMSSLMGETAKFEGFVARPIVELKDNRGNRIIVKIKVRDFEGIV